MRITVVGAGIMGLSVARGLVARGHRVVVLEQGVVPNPLGSSVDHHRLIRRPYGARAGYGAMVDGAYAAWERLWDDLGERLYAETGTLILAGQEATWADASAEEMAAAGLPVTWLTNEALAEQFPLLDMTGIERGFALKGGGVLFADRIVAGCARWIVEHGATLRAETRVAAIDWNSAVATLVGGEEVEADVMVVAAGPWAPRLVPDLAGRVTPSRQVVAYADPPTADADAWARHPMVLDMGLEDGFYIVPSVAGTPIKIGGHRFTLEGDPDRDRTPDDAEVRAILDVAGSRLRSLGEFQLRGGATCFYTVQPDECFVIERTGAVWIATGFSGHGFKFGALIGERLADAIDRDTDPGALTRWAAGGGI